MSSAAAGGARDAVARGAHRRGGPRLSSAADAAHELRGDEGARELCRCPSPSTLASKIGDSAWQPEAHVDAAA